MPVAINTIMKAVGYKITNTVNGMSYNGIVYKDLDIARRFEEHLSGKGGVILFEEGVMKFGRESFIIEEIVRGELEDVREWEHKQNIDNLWPKGYNGNAGRVIIRTEKTEIKRKNSFNKYLNSRSQEHVDAANKKRAATRAKRSKEEIVKTSEKLSAASKKHWDSMNEEQKQQFLEKRGDAKSKAYQSQTEEYKQAIRDKIRKSMCKKQYKSPAGIFDSTVEGGRAEGISPTLFNYRCKSKRYTEWEILTT